ncbi:MAG: ATP-binding protein [Kineosporiaceae bacterium]
MPEPLTEAGPPAAARGPLTVWEVTEPADLSIVRTALCERASEHVRRNSVGAVPVLASSAERVGLVFSELATNALRHGRTPVTVTLSRSADGWLLTVSDAHRDEGPVVVERARSRSGGHGIRLVTQLSRLVGWYRDPELKHVWAEVPDSPSPQLMASLQVAR